MKTKRPEQALNSLAWLRATCPENEIREGKEAVELALRACELSEWRDWGMIDTLAPLMPSKVISIEQSNIRSRFSKSVNPQTSTTK